MTPRSTSILAGISYLIIFFTAIFANFLVLETLQKNPLDTLQNHQMLIGFGILAFLITVVFDVIIAWALFILYKSHLLSGLSTLFRMMHAAIMAIGLFALVRILDSTTETDILNQLNIFNTIWLIGLFFFGIHLILLAYILKRPKIIAVFLFLAGLMYMTDTIAHFMLPDYKAYSDLFLALVAIPSIIGELSFTIWLLIKGGKQLQKMPGL